MILFSLHHGGGGGGGGAEPCAVVSVDGWRGRERTYCIKAIINSVSYFDVSRLSSVAVVVELLLLFVFAYCQMIGPSLSSSSSYHLLLTFCWPICSRGGPPSSSLGPIDGFRNSCITILG